MVRPDFFLLYICMVVFRGNPFRLSSLISVLRAHNVHIRYGNTSTVGAGDFDTNRAAQGYDWYETFPLTCPNVACERRRTRTNHLETKPDSHKCSLPKPPHGSPARLKRLSSLTPAQHACSSALTVRPSSPQVLGRPPVLGPQL